MAHATHVSRTRGLGMMDADIHAIAPPRLIGPCDGCAGRTRAYALRRDMTSPVHACTRTRTHPRTRADDRIARHWAPSLPFTRNIVRPTDAIHHFINTHSSGSHVCLSSRVSRALSACVTACSHYADNSAMMLLCELIMCTAIYIAVVWALGASFRGEGCAGGFPARAGSLSWRRPW